MDIVSSDTVIHKGWRMRKKDFREVKRYKFQSARLGLLVGW
jgi:hypothetical protein